MFLFQGVKYFFVFFGFSMITTIEWSIIKATQVLGSWEYTYMSTHRFCLPIGCCFVRNSCHWRRHRRSHASVLGRANQLGIRLEEQRLNPNKTTRLLNLNSSFGASSTFDGFLFAHFSTLTITHSPWETMWHMQNTAQKRLPSGDMDGLGWQTLSEGWRSALGSSQCGSNKTSATLTDIRFPHQPREGPL